MWCWSIPAAPVENLTGLLEARNHAVRRGSPTRPGRLIHQIDSTVEALITSAELTAMSGMSCAGDPPVRKSRPTNLRHLMSSNRMGKR